MKTTKKLLIGTSFLLALSAQSGFASFEHYEKATATSKAPTPSRITAPSEKPVFKAPSRPKTSSSDLDDYVSSLTTGSSSATTTTTGKKKIDFFASSVDTSKKDTSSISEKDVTTVGDKVYVKLSVLPELVKKVRKDFDDKLKNIGSILSESLTDSAAAKNVADSMEITGLAKDKGLGLFVKTTQEALNDIDVAAELAKAPNAKLSLII